jgi:hypothetical protein
VTTGEAGREESGQVSEPGDWEETDAELPVIEAMSLRQFRLIVGYYSKCRPWQMTAASGSA